MSGGADVFTVLGLSDSAAALIADTRPALIVDRSGTQLLWANAAGAAFFGLKTVERLNALRFSAAAPFARRIINLDETLAVGQDRIERLPLPRGLLPPPTVCKAQRIAVDGIKAILLLVVDGSNSLSGDPVAAYAALAATAARPVEEPAGPVVEPVTETVAAEAQSVPETIEAVAEPEAITEEAEVVAPAVEEPAAEDIERAPVAEAEPEVTATEEAPELIAATADAVAAEDVEPVAVVEDAPVAEPVEEIAQTAEAEAVEAEEATDEIVANEPPVEAAVPSSFVPPTHGRAVRFVFELDAGLAFTFVSPDLAETVGPAMAGVLGKSWQSVADDFGFDPAGRVGAALDHRDTFTGLTVDWPVEGADLRVPTDLAGMPVFGRERSFRGYRGFGVLKTGAAFESPALAPIPVAETVEPEPVEEITPSEEIVLETPALPEAIVDEAVSQDTEATEVADVETQDIVPDEVTSADEAAPEEVAEAPAVVEDEVVTEPEAIADEPVEAVAVVDSEPEDFEPSASVTADEPVSEEIAEVEAALEAADAAAETEAATVPEETVAEETEESEPEAEPETEPAPSAEIIQSPVVARRTAYYGETSDKLQALSKPERDAFDKIAEALADVFGPNRTTTPTAAPVQPLMTPVVAKAPVPGPLVDMALLDKIPVAMAILRDGVMIRANRAFLDLSGYPDLATLEADGGFDQVFEGAALTRDAAIPAVRRRDGVEIPVSARLHSLPMEDGIASLLVVQETAAATSRDRLATAEQRVEDLEAILDTATDGVLVLDQKGLVIGANRSAEALFGSERSHMIGMSFVDLLAPESHRSALDYLDGLTRNGLSSVLNDGREVIGRVAAGGLVPLFMTIGRVSLTKFCAVLRDITQWKRAEEELTSAKKAAENASSQKSDFLAKMSHEIRTPLNAIIGFSEVMMEERFGPVGNERYKEYLRDIHVSGTHIMSLVNDLLDLSKIEAGKLELTFEAVGLNDVVRECAALMQPQANRERIIIRTSLSSSLPPVVADNRSLRQIVLNLLSNAVKFNSAGGQVIISTLYEETGEVVLRVRDTGQGMAEGDIVKAMEPFRQLTTSRIGGGTGLGLPLTKALVEANRAGFQIDSTPGQGTMIQITFPSTRVLAE
jgi:PAS domain S-box-containing protein